MVDSDLPGVARLPEGYCIRPICYGDYDRGVLSVLEELAPVGEVTRTGFARYLHYIRNHREVHYTLVIVNKEDRVVAVGTLLLEPKL
jgi:glucosamine-phosphate N-acetyltransferase